MANREKFVVKWVNNFCRRTELVIANSKFTEKYLREKDKFLSLAVIPSGIKKIKKSRLSKKEFLKQYGLPSNAVVCLCVSRLSREKNLDLAIKAFSFLPESFFLLVIGSGLYEKKLKDLVGRANLDSRVRFLGRQPHEDLAKFYQNADVFVYPSFSETQGLVVFEASSFGLPVVTVDSDLSSEVFLSKIFKSISGDPGAFAGAIVAAFQSKRKNKSEVKKWADDFTIENLAEKLACEYQKTIDIFRLNQTGWQSWSVNRGSWLRFPRNRFNPLFEREL